MPRFLLCLTLVLLFIAGALRAEPPQTMKLFSRETVTPLKFTLDDSDWRWLGEQREINIATYSPENPPFSLVPEPGTFEGVSADYALLVMRYLGLRFNVLHYENRKAALAGILSGKVDMLLDDDGGVYTPQPGIVASIPYMPDHPALISRETAMSKPLAMIPDARIALVSGYMSDEWVLQHYPGARITRFPSSQGALSSVAFGENDYFIGNLTTASYLIERNYATTLSVADIFPQEETGPRFKFAAKDIPLQRSVNAVLEAISPVQHKVIFRHWSQGPNLWLFQSRLPLTDREKRWLSQHQELRVIINPLYAPFTLFDKQNQFHGISADILRLIHLRTGLNFKAVEAETVPDMFSMVQEHRGDFLASMSFSPARDQQLLFTRPYVQPPFVLVVRDTPGVASNVTEGMRIAVTPDNALRGWLKQRYPSVALVDAENASVAMQMVAEGRADAAVNNLISSRYLIDRYFRGQLTIATRLGDQTSRIGFAVGRDQPELFSILNKALADIPPRDISMIANKWQGTPDVQIDTWMVYRSEFYWLAGIFAVLVITSLIWNYYLHREIRLRKETQTRLQELAAFRETLFNGTPVPVYVVDARGHLINHNSAWVQFFHQEPSTLNSTPLISPQHPLSPIYQNIRSLLEDPEKHMSSPDHYRIHNGVEERTVIHQAVTYYDHTGNVAGLIGSWQDITEHEELTEALLQARENAEQANRAKSTFLATMSHEIRTPISAIIGLLELSVTDTRNTRALQEQETIRVAYDSALSLMGLIGDILDLAKIESGNLELMPEWIPVTMLAKPVAQVFDGLARQKGINLDYQLDALHPDEIYIDPMRFRQILSNLTSNAIKFTHQGSVTIQIQFLPGEASETILVLSVTDTGEGISPEEQVNIFTPYVQSESGKHRHGTGLGLAICNQITTMMHGSIDLFSQRHRGTKIMVKLPVAHRQIQAPQPEQSDSRSTVPTRPLQILAVDDHPANRLLLKQQLTRLGHKVVEAENGELALQYWEKQDFDLVITDCNMPVMDGLTLTRILRKEQKRPVIILGLTANAQPEERSRCIDAGMDDCLFKPLRLTQLADLLQKVPRQNSAPPIPEQKELEALVDLHALRELANHDNALLFSLLNTTKNENERDMEVCVTLAKQAKWEKLQQHLHRLAGSADIICAPCIADSCRKLEKACSEQNTPDTADILPRVQEVLSAFKMLNQAITSFTSMK
jgi:two-component system sensor histidine kinase EvgS